MHSFGRWWSLAVLAGLMVSGAAFAQQESTCAKGGCHEDVKTDEKHAPKVDCLGCHPNVKGDKAEEHPDALSEFGPEQMCGQAGCHPDAQPKVSQGKHADASCDQCHNMVHEDFATQSIPACRGCHKEAVLKFQEGVHAKENVRCAECHGDVHLPVLHTDLLSPMSKVMQPETCSECHDKKKDVRQFRTSAHGRALMTAGLDVAPTCSTCHGKHDIVRVDAENSPVTTKKVPELCGTCHKFILASYQESVHAKMLAEGKKAPVCISCHHTHGIADMSNPANRLKTPEECAECHEDAYESYRDSFHGKATRLGLAAAATCADCHTPHKMLKKDDPKSSVNPANLEKTCGKCHEGASGSFLQFNPHLNPAKAKDTAPVVHYIWLFMTVLLIGVLAFFSLHTLLWFQRAMVGFARKELRQTSHDGNGNGNGNGSGNGHAEPWVRRFKPLHIWVHITIILTFLSLAFTGLPLKFSYEGWAAPLSSIVGGLGGARYLHRFAGVLTFGYGLVFLFYLFNEIIIRRRRSILWGWQSMVPNGKDLKDLIGNLKWFLYLGDRPKFDRWAYWEKFDFFAVFWGIPVIGLSGLTLWFPVIAAKILPGWMLNVAYIVHSDEALLATGFIFFFHFFHTHLRPEAFPLDPVVFVGAMPLERFKEERPAEYERLNGSGELKKLLVPPPTERSRTLAQVFGFTALTLGVILGISLMWTGAEMLGKILGGH